jgi:uncharacterized protein YheU (UPF0270 family)
MSTAVRAPVISIPNPAELTGDIIMPIVTIQVTREGTRNGSESLTATEKSALIKGASQVCSMAQQAS